MNVSSQTCANLEVLDSNKSGIRVEFQRYLDRYRHTIHVVQDGLSTPLCESVEGSFADRWPPSPPIQDVSLAPAGDLQVDSAVALLVGRAGASHWSISVEAASPAEADLHNRCLVFDVACRVREMPEGLQSTYQMLTAPETATDRDVSRQGVRLGAYLLQPLVCDGESICEVVEVDRPGGQLVVRPQGTSRPVGPTTYRWRYAFSRLEGA